jgi:hypothetical protein
MSIRHRTKLRSANGKSSSRGFNLCTEQISRVCCPQASESFVLATSSLSKCLKEVFEPAVPVQAVLKPGAVQVCMLEEWQQLTAFQH